jgi:putative transcriptional regulator
MISPIQPQTGSLLISEPFMLDPNFKRSVVLLTELETLGSVGFVLNQKSEFLLSDLISDLKWADFPIFIGGPVEKDSLHFVHRCYDRLQSGAKIKDDLFWGGNFHDLKTLIENNEIKHDEIKFFVGYSGWSPGQIDAEILDNAWMASNAYDTELIFVEDEENLWREAIIGLGPKYAHIANFPEDHRWN